MIKLLIFYSLLKLQNFDNSFVQCPKICICNYIFLINKWVIHRIIQLIQFSLNRVNLMMARSNSSKSLRKIKFCSNFTNLLGSGPPIRPALTCTLSRNSVPSTGSGQNKSLTLCDNLNNRKNNQ